METMILFATILEALRKEKGLTQKQLADNLGVSRGTISFYEKAERTADIDFLVRCAKFFGVSVCYLLGLTKIRNPEIDIQEIHDRTGLWEKSIESIIGLHKRSEEDKISKMGFILLNYVFSEPGILDYLMLQLTQYLICCSELTNSNKDEDIERLEFLRWKAQRAWEDLFFARVEDYFAEQRDNQGGESDANNNEEK